VLFHEEGLHGYATRTPHLPAGDRARQHWDPGLIRQVDSIVGREIRARGVSMVLAPVVDVARDPRGAASRRRSVKTPI